MKTNKKYWHKLRRHLHIWHIAWQAREPSADKKTTKGKELAVHTVGGVVTPAQQLMIVVPREDQFEIEAWVQNKDIGFVNPDQDVEIKVEAFPFTRYGLIAGKVISLSKDAVPLKDVGYVYAAHVSMARTTMNVGNKVIELSPGMNVSVEVKTGKRRVLEFILSPLLRGIQETAHER